MDGGAFGALALACVKIVALVVLVAVLGRKAVPWLLRQVARTRSRELFTLCVLALALGFATGSAVVFGVSMALGAFLAGMIVGQTEVSHQAAAEALPMRDAGLVAGRVQIAVQLHQPGPLVHFEFSAASFGNLDNRVDDAGDAGSTWDLHEDASISHRRLILLSRGGRFRRAVADRRQKVIVFNPRKR